MVAPTGIQKQFRKTVLAVGGLAVGTDGDTATASGGAATQNSRSGIITTESLATASGADYTLTLTNSEAQVGDFVLAMVSYGGATTGTPVVARVQPANGSIVFIIRNLGSAALNGTLKILYMIIRPLAAASP